jgi:hypothetical protein
MTTFYCLRFETPPTWRTRSLYLYPPGTGSAYRERITCTFTTRCGPQIEHSLERFVCCNLRIRCQRNACSANRCSATVYSVLPRERVLTEAAVRWQVVTPQQTSTSTSPFRLSDTLVVTGTCLAKRYSTMDYSSFQTSCHTIILPFLS